MRLHGRVLRSLFLLVAFGTCLKLGTFDQTEIIRLWMSHYFNPSTSLLVKANLANVSTVGYSPNNLANCFTADLDALVYSSSGLVIGWMY